MLFRNGYLCICKHCKKDFWGSFPEDETCLNCYSIGKVNDQLRGRN